MAKNQEPLISEALLKRLSLLLIIGGMLVITVFLVLISVRPQGRFVVPDTRQHQQTREQAEASLNRLGLNEDGTAAIPIELAMQLLAEEGAVILAAPPPPPPPPVEPEVAVALPDGSAIYAAHCAACHQPTGLGIPGAFPPLAGHAPELYNVAGGREFLLKTILYGLVGPITIDGVTYNLPMPAFPQLSDADIAAVLNYTLTAWGNEALLPADFVPLEPQEVAALRGLDLTPTDVHTLRQGLGLE
jgi:mono/diheme cytochrome c family protein